MSIVAIVLFRSSFTVADSATMVELLRETANDVRDSRKGRNFQGVLGHAVFSVEILPTEEYDYEFEDELLDRGLLFDDAPDACVIEFGVRNKLTEAQSKLLAQKIAKNFNGIDCGIISD